MRKRIWYFFANPHWPFKFFKDLLSPVVKVAGIALAPFTGGASLAATAALTGVEQVAAQKKAEKQAAEQRAQQQAQQQAQAASNRVLNPDSIVSGQPVSTQPVTNILPSPIPLPLPIQAPLQQQRGVSPVLLLGGFVVLIVMLITRR